MGRKKRANVQQQQYYRRPHHANTNKHEDSELKEDQTVNGGLVLSSSASSSAYNRQVTFNDGISKLDRDYYMKPTGRGLVTSPSIGTLNRLERQKIVLWRRPLQTVHYASRELLRLVFDSLRCLSKYKAHIILMFLLVVVCACLFYKPGAHQEVIEHFSNRIMRCLYWVGLGVLSSIGLGTGLHTFILYLGPHIASVTMAAYECNSLNFPEPPYPERIICPQAEGLIETAVVTMWSIMSKVRVEALMWGAGTALGELPPYFMAKAARLSGEEPEDEEYREFLAFINRNGPKAPTFTDKCKVVMEKAVTNLGFLGILSFASIPNPFFDLAGITCGHFLVPFWKFFLATLIGKAIFKMHLQMFFVVLAFSEKTVEQLINRLNSVPFIGSRLHLKLTEYLTYQKNHLHHQNGIHHVEESNLLQKCASLVVTSMILWFILSLINSLAQNWHKRLCDAKTKAV